MARKRRRSSRKNATINSPKPAASEHQALPIAVEVSDAAVEAPEPVAVPPTAEAIESIAQSPSQVDQVPADDSPRVLAVFPDSSVLRLIRESIGAFTGAVADTTPDVGFGFEMAMQRDYRMFFFGFEMPVLDGERLYDFIAKAYVHARPVSRVAPGVVYLSTSGIRNLSPELTRDARVKGVLSCPFEISRLLSYTEGILPTREVGV